MNARDPMSQGGKLAIQLAEVELDDACAALQVDTIPGTYVILAMSDPRHGDG